MKKLNLGSNPIGDAGAIVLSQCVNKIEKLSVVNCNFTNRGMEALAQQIKKNDFRV